MRPNPEPGSWPLIPAPESQPAEGKLNSSLDPLHAPVVRIRRLRHRDAYKHLSPALIRFNLQIPAELPKPLAHSANPHTRSALENLLQPVRRNPAALILDLHGNRLRAPCQPDTRRLAPRVTVNVGQRLL